MLRLLRYSLATVITVMTGWFIMGFLGSSDLNQPWFAIGVNFVLMFWIVAVVTLTKPNLNRKYFDVAGFEKGGRVYQRFGALHFQSVLRAIGWEAVVRQTAVTRPNIEQLKYQTRSSEFGHLVCLVIVLSIAAYLLVSGKLAGSAWVFLTAVALHAYPIMLQRHNRPRYRRILAAYHRRNSLGSTPGDND